MASVLLTVGVLALEGTALAVERMVTEGERLSGVAAAAGARLEMLRAAGCGAPGEAAATDGRYALRWTVAGSGPLRPVSLAVTYRDGRGPRTELVESVTWCP